MKVFSDRNWWNVFLKILWQLKSSNSRNGSAKLIGWTWHGFEKATFTETKITLISLNTQLTAVQNQSKLHCSRLKESLQLVHNFKAHKYIWQIYDKKMATQKWPKNWKMTFLHSHIIAWQCSNMVFLTRKQIQVSQYTVSLILRSLKPNTYVFIIWSHDYTGVPQGDSVILFCFWMNGKCWIWIKVCCGMDHGLEKW